MSHFKAIKSTEGRDPITFYSYSPKTSDRPLYHTNRTPNDCHPFLNFKSTLEGQRAAVIEDTSRLSPKPSRGCHAPYPASDHKEGQHQVPKGPVHWPSGGVGGGGGGGGSRQVSSHLWLAATRGHTQGCARGSCSLPFCCPFHPLRNEREPGRYRKGVWMVGTLRFWKITL